MSQLLVFNHHSLPFHSKKDASNAIPEFLKICIKANNLGLSTLLLDESVDCNWFRLRLADGYYWQDWYNQNNNDQQIDIIRAFRSIQTRQPLFSAEDTGTGSDFFEVRFQGSESFSALRAAVWHESPITSFPTGIPWNETPISVEVNELNETAEMISSTSDINNLFSTAIVDNLESVLSYERNNSIQSGNEILNTQQAYFPFICFCGMATEQLLHGYFSKTIFDQIKESIIILNSFCANWENGFYDNYSHANLRMAGLNHNVSGESSSVLQDPTLRNEREFWLPNGRKELFENHIKISKGYRIHFYVNPDNKKVYIGYIGNHLRLK